MSTPNFPNPGFVQILGGYRPLNTPRPCDQGKYFQNVLNISVLSCLKQKNFEYLELELDIWN